jgi:catechol 2,3-dioxygenase-like lactoylglutathione lyase family enzyme
MPPSTTEVNMFDHIGIKVRDLQASAAFYTAVLAPLGHVKGYADESSVGFGPAEAPSLWLYACDQPVGPGSHIAIRAADPAAVDRFHRAALQAGGRDNGAPGPRPHYSATYYAAFVIDPDGNNVEAVRP